MDMGQSTVMMKKMNVTEKTVLLPPSEFEKPAAGPRDLERAQRHLQVEHEMNKNFQNQFQHHVGAPLFAYTKNDYADELIQRQAGEIAELRSELMKCRRAYEQDAADWKEKFSVKEEEHRTEVKLLERHLARAEDEFEEKLSRITAELERTVKDKESETSALTEKLESTKLTLDKRIWELEEELNSLQRESDHSRRHLETELRNKSQMIDDQVQEISRLKTYICQTEHTHKPALAWKMEKEALDNKLKVSQAENEKLVSTIELMEVRFKALNQILCVQEKELGQAKIGGPMSKSKQASSLVTRWREKVFSLLVQQKTAEILHKKDVSNLHQKIHSLEDELAASQAQVQVLQHSLTDKMAQLQIEVNKKEKLQEELEQIHHVAVCLDDQSKHDYDSVKSLLDFVERSKNQHDKAVKMMEEKSSLLRTLGQRISFATSRMEFIKTQLIRKSALSQGVSKDTVQSLSVSPDDQDVSRETEKLVYQELEQLTRERDSLAAQVRADSEKWSEILKEARSQHTAEIAALKGKIADQEYQLQQKSKNCVQLTEEVDNMKDDAKEKDTMISQLQMEVARHARGVESVLTDQKLKDEAEWSQKFADLERKLNSSKREHAKAVVSLRHMEQSHQRRLQQEQDLLRTTEDHLTRQIQQLENRLKSVERERNLMMATLRQEGLLGQLRSERGKFIQFVDDEDSGSRNTITNRTESDKSTNENTDIRWFDAREQTPVESQDFVRNSAHTTMTLDTNTRSHHEPVQVVLEELKSLTAAIFDDDDDDDEEDSDVEKNKQDGSDDSRS